MNIEESDIQQAILETGDYLGYFHTGDSHRGYMGSGSIDLAGVFRALVKSGYQGPITFEVVLIARRRPAARRHSRHLAQPMGRQPRSRRACADVHTRSAQGGARGSETSGTQPPALACRNARDGGRAARCENGVNGLTRQRPSTLRSVSKPDTMVSRLLTTNGKPTSFEGLLDLIAASDGRRRSVVAIASAPGSGKSALAERLVFRRKRRVRRSPADGRSPL